MAEETVTIEEREFNVTHDDGSSSTIKGIVITTDHGVTDENGYPKISTHMSLDPVTPNMPAHLVYGEQEEGAK